jgi:hypothetical protein
MSKPDISAIMTLHREGPVCVPSLRSFLQCCAQARSSGLTVECLAALDRPDNSTMAFFEVFAGGFDVIEQVNVGDLSKSRNIMTLQAGGRYVAFFDGDDLWGETWLSRAIEFASVCDENSVFHPQVIYYFVSDDFALNSQTVTPHPEAASFLMLHEDSSSPEFNKKCLSFDNVWTSNSFAKRELYLRHPFPEFRRESGFGIEDWSWNYRTLRSGVAHRVVPETVHMVRVKEAGSLGAQNVAECLLPDFYGVTTGEAQNGTNNTALSHASAPSCS